LFIADGTLITTFGQGEIHISPSLILKNVLLVPKLSTNLISIQKHTKDLSCIAIFDNNMCVLHDKDLGRTIEHAKEWNDHYYVENPKFSTRSHSLVIKFAMIDK